jgi:hypothetical protein
MADDPTHKELEERLKDFLTEALKNLHEKISLDIKNSMLVHDKEISVTLNNQNMEILLLKKEIENIKLEIIHLQDFKKEVRGQLSGYASKEEQFKGGLAVGKYIFAGIVSAITLGVNFLFQYLGGK